MARASATLVALFVSLPACNAILGMERAHLDDASDASTPKGTGGRPSTTGGAGGAVASGDKQLRDCTTTSDECMQCLDEKCGGVSADCLADTDCRNAVQRHTTCLANHACKDTSCASSIENNASLASCYAGCTDKCSDRGLMPICNLYCACMQAECTGEFSQTLGGTLQKCIDACNTTPAIKDNAICREDHCELVATFGADPHCSHAVGKLGQCTGPIPICLTGINTGLGPCMTNDDCCSKNCTHNICATPQ